MQKIYRLGEIMRTWGLAFIQKFNPHTTVKKAIESIALCRTPRLGGRQIICENCGNVTELFNSCGNRNCPICQSTKKELWIDKTANRLLPVAHSHVVFTLPHQLNPFFMFNMRQLYNLLFQSANAALCELCADPDRLGAKPGLIAVLHTWGSNLSFHPHLHCIVSAGGWQPNNQLWVQPKHLKSGFFLPQKVLSACFKKHFLARFVALWEEGTLQLPAELANLYDTSEFRRFYNAIAFKKGWIVKIMPPLDNPQRILDYLGRYVFRIAITDNRIKDINTKEQLISFEYKDYSAQTSDDLPPPIKSLTLDAFEFIRRFAQHVLPQGFQKIRYFGIYATPCQKTIIPLIRIALNLKTWATNLKTVAQIVLQSLGFDPNLCPCCGARQLIVVPLPKLLPAVSQFLPTDTDFPAFPRPPPIDF